MKLLKTHHSHATQLPRLLSFLSCFVFWSQQGQWLFWYTIFFGMISSCWMFILWADCLDNWIKRLEQWHTQCMCAHTWLPCSLVTSGVIAGKQHGVCQHIMTWVNTVVAFLLSCCYGNTMLHLCVCVRVCVCVCASLYECMCMHVYITILIIDIQNSLYRRLKV